MSVRSDILTACFNYHPDIFAEHACIAVFFSHDLWLGNCFLFTHTAAFK